MHRLQLAGHFGRLGVVIVEAGAVTTSFRIAEEIRRYARLTDFHRLSGVAGIGDYNKVKLRLWRRESRGEC